MACGAHSSCASQKYARSGLPHASHAAASDALPVWPHSLHLFATTRTAIDRDKRANTSRLRPATPRTLAGDSRLWAQFDREPGSWVSAEERPAMMDGGMSSR